MDDLISRQQAIDALHTWFRDGFDEDKWWNSTHVLAAIEGLPPAQHGTNLAEVGTDCISRQAAIEALAEDMPRPYTPDGSHPADEGIFMAQEIYADCIQTLKELPSAQPERTCVNCGRTANNGGWYADGRTRCPIEEHYALPKDGYCHLWEKRNVTDDDYPERREE